MKQLCSIVFSSVAGSHSVHLQNNRTVSDENSKSYLYGSAIEGFSGDIGGI